MKKKKTIDNRIFKKEGEELQQYLHFRKRGSVVENKKAKARTIEKSSRKLKKTIDN